MKAAIICGEQDTFVQFLYPRNGLNWLQGDQGESGLPDIRAQAGFIAEDGRYFTVVGSGTENVSIDLNINYMYEYYNGTSDHDILRKKKQQIQLKFIG